MRLACTAAVIVTATGVLPSATHALPKLAARASRSFYADGTILAVAATPDRIYVGGDFTLIGAPTGSWVPIRADGTAVQGRPAVEGSIVAAVADGRGGWFIAGAISGVGAAERSATVAHLRATGALDRSWQVAVRGGRVRALAIHGRSLFLGGSFARIDGKPRRGLAAVDAVRGTLLAWRLKGDPHFARAGKQPARPGAIQTLALSKDGGTLYVAGSFNRIGGERRLGLAAAGLTSGRITRWNPAPNGSVTTIEPAPAGRSVFLGGYFTRVGGARRNAIAAVNTRNGRSLAFNAHASQYTGVSGLAVTFSVVYVAGDFTTLGGKSRHLLAALDARSGAVTAWEPNVSGDEVTAVSVDPRQNAVYIAGDLSEVGGQRRDALAAVDAHTGNVTPWDPRGLGSIQVLVRSGGLLFAGGDIAFVGGSRRHGLAAIGSDGSLSDWNPQLDGVVRALALRPDNSRLYVGGAFAPGDAPAQRNLAVVDVSTGALHAFGGGTNSGVWALAPSTDASTLYVGGAFVSVAGKRRVRLAALDATTGALLSWNAGANDLVRRAAADRRRALRRR